MKVNAIKTLVENLDKETLQKLQDELENEKPLSHEVDGQDEGEKLTHILAAISIQDEMMKNGTDCKTELRKFTARVRTSISTS